MKPKNHILPVIIFSQFACTSLWFAGNAIVEQLAQKTGLGPEIVGYVLSSVQLGFISGTFIFALLMVVDRFPPARVFLFCALLGAICNTFLLAASLTKWSLLVSRFGTGFFLAGIYPVGMKIASDYYDKGLGRALGYLVGALVLGSSLPFLIKGLNWGTDDAIVVKTTTGLAVFGGVLLWLLVPNGPFRKPSTQLQLKAAPTLFHIPDFRKAAFGYFGHMWELYAFWAFTPLAIQTFNTASTINLPIALGTFTVVALGGVSCMLGGLLSIKYGSKKVAAISLATSGTLCLLSPLLFTLPSAFFLVGWCFWGMAVTADSPQFSSLVAKSVPAQLKGTALTLVNCLGFALSIVSIQLLAGISTHISTSYLFVILGIGPLIGLWHLIKKARNF